jgi:glutamate-1-semialdehyde 2,1-aminomutase
MAAIRLARAYTKKYKIVKMEGGYHGSHDLVEISIEPAIEKAGPIESPHSVPEDMSIPPNVLKDCIIAPFNQSETAAKILTQHKEELAAVIVEPLQMACGAIPPTFEFLETIREVTSKYKIPLIFDEVVSLRLASGGCQEIYNIMPDITALGKIIGGGYPVGAVAGREEFMDLFSPLNDNTLLHSGTFNGNPITMAAGVASMNALTVSEIERINELGDRLRAKFSSVLEEVGIIAQVTGMGSLAQIHFTGQQVSDWRSAATGRIDIRSILHLLLMDRGVFIATRAAFNVSTAMGEQEIQKASEALKESLLEMRPYIEKASPDLIAD